MTHRSPRDPISGHRVELEVAVDVGAGTGPVSGGDVYLVTNWFSELCERASGY